MTVRGMRLLRRVGEIGDHELGTEMDGAVLKLLADDGAIGEDPGRLGLGGAERRPGGRRPVDRQERE